VDKEKVERLRGIIVPLYMPLTKDEKIDEEDLRKLIRYVLDKGVHVLFTSGGCGEFPTLTLKERRRADEIVVDEAQGKVPVIVGVGDCSTKKSLEHINHARKIGADFVLAPPPYYYVLDQQGVKKYFTELADQGELPLIMYNVPVEVKAKIELNTVVELAKHENIAGIKDSSGNIAYFEEVVMETQQNSNFRSLVGEDNNSLPALMFGAYGAVLGSSNIMPEAAVRMYNEVKAGNYQKAQEYFEKILLLIDRVYYGCSYDHGGCKTALQLMGIFKGRYVTSPMMIPTDEETEAIRGRLKELKLI
jgi:4-hydroxy-tetrahydrodipicolinate synthase